MPYDVGGRSTKRTNLSQRMLSKIPKENFAVSTTTGEQSQTLGQRRRGNFFFVERSHAFEKRELEKGNGESKEELGESDNK